MKKNDLITVCCVVLLLAPFLFSQQARDLFSLANSHHGYVLSFVKFAVLATFGEMLALRIVSGCYWHKDFGLLPRMLVWGCLGVLIKGAFTIFATGTPHLLASFGVPVEGNTLVSGAFPLRLLTAFTISCALNIIFAPVMMTLHKITDTHIAATNGKIRALLPIDFATILKRIDWNVMWNFVFKKTIPFFWIPAHTITFLMPGEFRVLFAAFLGIMLGLILAFAGGKKEKIQ